MSEQALSSDSIIEECQNSLAKATGKDRAAIYERMADAYTSSNKLQKAIVCYQEALDIYGPKVRFYDRLADILEQLNRSKEAEAILNKALKELTDPIDLAKIHTRIALVMNRRGLLKDGRKEVDIVLKMLEGTKPSGDEIDLMYYRLYNVLGQYESSEGNLERSLSNFKKSLEFCTKINDMKGILNIRNNIGIVLMNMGQLKESLDYFDKALADAEKTNLPTKAGLIYVNIGNSRVRLGDLKGAEEACLRSIELCKETDQFYVIAFAQMHLTETFYEVGDYRTAKRWGERSVLNFKKTGDTSHEGRVLTLLAQVAIANNAIIDAERLLSEVASKNQKDLEPEVQALYWRVSGLLFIAKDDIKAAEKSIKKSLDAYESLGLVFESGQAYALLARLYLASGKKDDAKKALDKARKIFSERGAQGELSKLSDLPS